MPNLSEDTESRIVEWLKKEGDTIARGEPIAVIETDKASMEIESLHTGTLVEIVHGDGAEVPIGETIAYVET
jgi:pyruvate/2-oxoglutarate dehydrogenase complex dihydrolipoamide acyltransferase (E2) component